MEEKREVTINISKEQLEVLKGIFVFHGWELDITRNSWEAKNKDRSENHQQT